MSEDARTKTLTRHLRELEGKLYAIRDDATKVIHVMREGTELRGPYEYDGMVFKYTVSSPCFICALTDNWTSSGSPRDWGIDQVIARLREIDSWNRADMFDEMRQGRARTEASQSRARINQHEAWLRDNKNVFRDAFKDINTSNLNVREKEHEIGRKTERN